MKNIHLFLVLTICAAGFSRAEDMTGAAFLKIDPSVRNQAMGGGQTAYSFGSQAVGANPANVSVLKGAGEVTASFGTLQGDSSFGYAAAAVKSGGRVWALSATELSSGKMDRRDDAGAVTGSFDAMDVAVGMTVSQKVGGSLRAGVTAKAVRSDLGDYSTGWVPAGDLGLGLAVKKTYWGLSVTNVGGGMKYREETESLPAAVNAGGAVGLGSITVTGGASRYLKDGKTTAGVGVEYELGPLSLRAGYRGETGSNLALASHESSYQMMSGLTTGVGIKVDGLRIDYAVNTAAAEWGFAHRAAITYAWGGAPSAAKRPRAYSRSSFNNSGKRWVK